MGRWTDWRLGRKQGVFFTSRNIRKEQEHTPHNNCKGSQFQSSILWFIHFIKGEKYRALVIITPLPGGESKAEKRLAALSQGQTGMHEPVLWCREKTSSSTGNAHLPASHRHTSSLPDSQASLHSTLLCLALRNRGSSETRVHKYADGVLFGPFLFLNQLAHQGCEQPGYGCCCWLTFSHSLKDRAHS